MIAFTASFLCSALLGLRLGLPAFLPLMLLAAAGAAATHGILAGVLVLAASQTGYLCGVILRALAPLRQTRPALRQAAVR